MTKAGAPPVGLLLDVDGPVASPVDRAVVQPTIVPDLIALLNFGVPIVFNTGRSEEFLRHEVVEPLQEAGIPNGARLHGVAEKGGVCFDVVENGVRDIRIDRRFALPDEFARRAQALVEHRYHESVFFDQTKHVMVSIEQHLDTPSDEFLEMRDGLVEELFVLCADLGLGVVLHDRVHPDARGETPFRIDPTIISVDIEASVLGKDFGAKRALDMLATNGELPQRWRTVGDSRTDYKMSDWLHDRGFDVAHVDVRPEEGVPERPYPIFTPQPFVINDEAGAAYLRRIREVVEGSATDEAGF